jgi:hypothetical protein
MIRSFILCILHKIYYQLNPRDKILLEKLTVSQIFNKLFAYYTLNPMVQCHEICGS